MIIKEWMIANPKLSVILISFLVTLVMTLITKKFTNQERIKELKKIQKDSQAKAKEHGGNPQKMAEIQKEIMSSSLELMKHSFKPLLITFIPLLVLFWWLKGVYTDVFSSWIWWYIGVSVISSIILRKIFKVV